MSGEVQDGLARVGLLRALPRDALGRLAQACVTQHCGAGELVLSQDDRSDDVIFVLAGRLKVQLFSASGQQVIFRELEAGDMLGELSAIDGRPRSASVLAATDAAIARLAAAEFRALLDAHAGVRTTLLRQLVATVRDLSERVFEISTLSARSRVRAHLLRLARQAGVQGNRAEISPVPVQSDLADQLATHREMVSREMSALTRAGILERRQDALLVHDVRRLRALVDAEGAD